MIRNQYLLIPRNSHFELGLSEKNKDFLEYKVIYDENLDCTILNHDGSALHFLLLGYIFDPHNPELSNAQILFNIGKSSKSNKEEILKV